MITKGNVGRINTFIFVCGDSQRTVFTDDKVIRINAVIGADYCNGTVITDRNVAYVNSIISAEYGNGAVVTNDNVTCVNSVTVRCGCCNGAVVANGHVICFNAIVVAGYGNGGIVANGNVGSQRNTDTKSGYGNGTTVAYGKVICCNSVIKRRGDGERSSVALADNCQIAIGEVRENNHACVISCDLVCANQLDSKVDVLGINSYV